MPGLGFKLGRFFYIADTLDNLGAARMETAAGGWFDQARRLTSRDFFLNMGVSGIRIRGGFKQRQRVRMFGGMQNMIHLTLLDNLSGIHDEDALREIAHSRQIVGYIDYSQVVA